MSGARESAHQGLAAPEHEADGVFDGGVADDGLPSRNQTVPVPDLHSAVSRNGLRSLCAGVDGLLRVSIFLRAVGSAVL